MFSITIIMIISISIYHSLYFDCRITNNSMCIVCLYILGLTITGCFLKLVMLALNRFNNNRALFQVRSPIKIHSTPRQSLVKLITLNGYSNVINYFAWIRSIYNCIKIYPTTIGLPLLLLCSSVLAANM